MRTVPTLMVAAHALIGVSRLPAQDTGPGVGEQAPAVVIHDLGGQPVDLGRYLGSKPVFLEFWATWCESCKALVPRVRSAQAQYGDRVEFIGVNVTVNEKPERVRAYLQENQLNLLPLYDDEGTSIRAYQVPATSYVVIANRSGKIVYTGLGGTQNFDQALRRVTQP